jgi:hypothetical protein
MRGVLLLLLFLSPVLLKGQGAYVISLKNDTLRGEVRILTYDLIDRIQIKSDKKKESFTAVQIRLVSLDGKKYVPVKIDKSIRMMEVITTGYLSLYGFRLANQMTYDGRFLSKRGGSSMEVPNLTFKKTMASFLEDCQDVAAKISSNRWGKKELDSIIYQYNACIEGKSTRSEPASEQPKGFETLRKIQQFKEKVEKSDLESKKDALDLLNDLSQKVSKQETVPNYLTEGLKSYLTNKPEFSEDLAELLALIKN